MKKTLFLILLIVTLLRLCCCSYQKETITVFPIGTIQISDSEYSVLKDFITQYQRFDKNQYPISFIAMEQFLDKYYVDGDVTDVIIYYNKDLTNIAMCYKVRDIIYLSEIDSNLLKKMMAYKNKFVEPMIEVNELGTFVLSTFGKSYLN